MYETVKVIRLSDMDEVKDFVRAAGGCDFDIDVKCDRTFIDANIAWYDWTWRKKESSGLLRWKE